MWTFFFKYFLIVCAEYICQIEAIKYIANKDIAGHLVENNPVTGGNRPMCPPYRYVEANSRIEIPTDSKWLESSDSLARKWNLQAGGEWQPKVCTARYFAVIIIAHRNREMNLWPLIRYIHPFLQRQKIHYKIYLIEQNSEDRFNKGALFNAGFLEAAKETGCSCFIFHDVDKLPLNLNNIYACTKEPRHMSVALSDFHYRLPYETFFGGVFSISDHQYKLANGCSNKFYEWGAVDDDFFNRVNHVGLNPVRFDRMISAYKHLGHEESIKLKERFRILKVGSKFYNFGLNTVNYSILYHSEEPLFTRIVVRLSPSGKFL